jgi:uncharacterized protein YjbJ (UPF0337 family)
MSCGPARKLDPYGTVPSLENILHLPGRQSMKQSIEDKAKGTFHEVKGKVKEKIGRATNNPDLETDGQIEKIGGKVQKKVGQVEKVLGE